GPGGAGGAPGVGGAPTGCAHDVCIEGGPLDATCSTCASAVCGADSFCCTSQWDSQCVNEVADNCGMPCVDRTGGAASASAAASSVASASSAASGGATSSSSRGGPVC